MEPSPDNSIQEIAETTAEVTDHDYSIATITKGTRTVAFLSVAGVGLMVAGFAFLSSAYYQKDMEVTALRNSQNAQLDESARMLSAMSGKINSLQETIAKERAESHQLLATLDKAVNSLNYRLAAKGIDYWNNGPLVARINDPISADLAYLKHPEVLAAMSKFRIANTPDEKADSLKSLADVLQRAGFTEQAAACREKLAELLNQGKETPKPRGPHAPGPQAPR